MTWLDFIALVLAVGAPINAWLLDQGPLNGLREWIVAWGEIAPPDDDPWQETRWDRCKERIAKLATCRFCLHYHWPVLLLVFYAISLCCSPPWSTLWKFPVYSLAATRLSFVLSQWWSEEEHDRQSSQR